MTSCPLASQCRTEVKLPPPETMLLYASILEKPRYDVHKGVKYLLPRGEIINAAIAALRHCASSRLPSDHHS